MGKTKKLNLANLKKMDAKFNQKRELLINGYTVTVEEYLRPTKIQKLIVGMQNDIQNLESLGHEIDSFGLIAVQLIDQFTDIDMPTDTLERLKVIEILIDNEFLVPIMNAFNQEELEKATEMIQRSTDAQNELLKQIEEELRMEELEEQE